MTQASPAVVKIPTTGAGERREALGEGEEGPPLGPEPGPRQRERPRGHSRRRVRGNQQLQSLAPRFRYRAEQSRGQCPVRPVQVRVARLPSLQYGELVGSAGCFGGAGEQQGDVVAGAGAEAGQHAVAQLV
jgi:hypothetical protein